MAKRNEKTFPRKISIHLNDKERAEAKDKLVVVDNELIAIQAAKRADMSDYNERLRDKRAEQETLLKAIKTGALEKEVEVYERRDDRRGVMVYFRADNDEQVDERALTAEELKQPELPLNRGDDDEGEDTGETTEEGGKVVRFRPGRKAKKKASKKGRGNAEE